jgi:SAM-dependent methyltransferase
MIDNQYWDEFYAKSSKVKRLSYPSQFAAFVYGEMGDVENVLEFGCGTGRDAFFFAEFGKRVFAFDGAQSVITANRKKSDGHLYQPSFQVFDVDGEFPGTGDPVTGTKCVYARFFIHALRNDQIERFFALCESILTKGEKLYLEYRTEKDAEGVRETGQHYRNYLNSRKVTEMLGDVGFKCQYSVEGVGFAKWGADDAYVARHVMERIDG